MSKDLSTFPQRHRLLTNLYSLDLSDPIHLNAYLSWIIAPGATDNVPSSYK